MSDEQYARISAMLEPMSGQMTALSECHVVVIGRDGVDLRLERIDGRLDRMDMRKPRRKH